LPPVVVVLSLAGGAFLVWMGGSMLLDAVRGTMTLSLDAETSASRLGPVLRGAAVSLSNPYWMIWWATVGLKIASDAIAVGPVAVGAFFIGHELADFAWYALIIAAVAKGRHLFSDRVYRAVIGVCAAFLVFLGIGYVLAGVRAW
jgi:threonine/homoserine/homoserine lactone efflux protein